MTPYLVKGILLYLKYYKDKGNSVATANFKSPASFLKLHFDSPRVHEWDIVPNFRVLLSRGGNCPKFPKDFSKRAGTFQSTRETSQNVRELLTYVTSLKHPELPRTYWELPKTPRELPKTPWNFGKRPSTSRTPRELPKNTQNFLESLWNRGWVVGGWVDTTPGEVPTGVGRTALWHTLPVSIANWSTPIMKPTPHATWQTLRLAINWSVRSKSAT